MADPAGAALRAGEALKSDGHCLLMEPVAGDHLADNLNPVGRLNYCTRAKMVKDLRTVRGRQAGGGTRRRHRRNPTSGNPLVR